MHRGKVPAVTKSKEAASRDAKERDDAGRSNCESGGPIIGPEITEDQFPNRSIHRVFLTLVLAHSHRTPWFCFRIHIPRLVRLIITTIFSW